MPRGTAQEAPVTTLDGDYVVLGKASPQNPADALAQTIEKINLLLGNHSFDIENRYFLARSLLVALDSVLLEQDKPSPRTIREVLGAAACIEFTKKLKASFIEVYSNTPHPRNAQKIEDELKHYGFYFYFQAMGGQAELIKWLVLFSQQQRQDSIQLDQAFDGLFKQDVFEKLTLNSVVLSPLETRANLLGQALAKNLVGDGNNYTPKIINARYYASKHLEYVNEILETRERHYSPYLEVLKVLEKWHISLSSSSVNNDNAIVTSIKPECEKVINSALISEQSSRGALLKELLLVTDSKTFERFYIKAVKMIDTHFKGVDKKIRAALERAETFHTKVVSTIYEQSTGEPTEEFGLKMRIRVRYWSEALFFVMKRAMQDNLYLDHPAYSKLYIQENIKKVARAGIMGRTMQENQGLLDNIIDGIVSLFSNLEIRSSIKTGNSGTEKVLQKIDNLLFGLWPRAVQVFGNQFSQDTYWLTGTPARGDSDRRSVVHASMLDSGEIVTAADEKLMVAYLAKYGGDSLLTSKDGSDLAAGLSAGAALLPDVSEEDLTGVGLAKAVPAAEAEVVPAAEAEVVPAAEAEVVPAAEAVPATIADNSSDIHEQENPLIALKSLITGIQQILMEYTERRNQRVFFYTAAKRDQHVEFLQSILAELCIKQQEFGPLNTEQNQQISSFVAEKLEALTTLKNEIEPPGKGSFLTGGSRLARGIQSVLEAASSPDQVATSARRKLGSSGH